MAGKAPLALLPGPKGQWPMANGIDNPAEWWYDCTETQKWPVGRPCSLKRGGTLTRDPSHPSKILTVMVTELQYGFGSKRSNQVSPQHLDAGGQAIPTCANGNETSGTFQPITKPSICTNYSYLGLGMCVYMIFTKYTNEWIHKPEANRKEING